MLHPGTLRLRSCVLETGHAPTQIAIFRSLGQLLSLQLLAVAQISMIATGWSFHCNFQTCVANEIERGQSGGNMAQTSVYRNEDNEIAEQKLWRAVIASTVQEWVEGPLRRKREAEQFLFNDNKDYRTVCYSAGINPENLRDRLQKIRARDAAEARVEAVKN